MTTLSLVKPDRDRSTYIGSSDIAAILGVCPYRSPLDVYLDKVVGREPITDPDKLKVLRRGSRMEPYITDLLAEETGIKIIARNHHYTDPEHPFIASEIDAETEEENIEIKSVSPFKAKEWGEQQTDEIPVHYQAQAMHGLMVRPKKRTIFGVLIGGDDFRIYTLLPDPDVIQIIREKEVEFWHKVKNRIQPEPTRVSDIIRIYGKLSKDKIVEASEDLLTAVIKLKRAKETIAEAKKEADELEEQIKLALQDADTLAYHGKPLLTWRTHQTTRVSEGWLKENHPLIYEASRKKSDVRTLRLK